MTDAQVALLAAAISLPSWTQRELLERADAFLAWLRERETA